MKKQTVIISVPATTANLGPGFDCLGMALELYNDFTFTISTSGEDQLSINVQGVDADKVTTDENNLVYKSAAVIFEKVSKRPFPLQINQINRIPVGSGLGSSSTAVLAGMMGANALLGQPFTDVEILHFAINKEGHSDNVAPALYGNLVLGVMVDGGFHIEQIELPELTAVVILPTFHFLTDVARGVLPDQISRVDAIFNASRTPLLVRALQLADYDKLAIAMQDRVHQQYRIPLIPGMEEAFAAAYAAGARGVAVSGAGPSLIAFAPDGHEKIAAAVTAVFATAGLDSRYWVLPVNTQGAVFR